MEDQREGDAEHAAERAQGSCGGGLGVRWRGGEGLQHFGVAQEVFEVRRIGGGLVAEFGDDPGVAARELDGAGAAVLVWARRARGGVLAGGEAGEEGGEAAQGAAEAVVERHEEDAEEGGAGVDEVAQGGDDLIDAECESDGWVRGGCAVQGAVGVHVHDMFNTTTGGPVQWDF